MERVSHDGGERRERGEEEGRSAVASDAAARREGHEKKRAKAFASGTSNVVAFEAEAWF